jgi:hypothetical protein
MMQLLLPRARQPSDQVLLSWMVLDEPTTLQNRMLARNTSLLVIDQAARLILYLWLMLWLLTAIPKELLVKRLRLTDLDNMILMEPIIVGLRIQVMIILRVNPLKRIHDTLLQLMWLEHLLLRILVLLLWLEMAHLLVLLLHKVPVPRRVLRHTLLTILKTNKSIHVLELAICALLIQLKGVWLRL